MSVETQDSKGNRLTWLGIPTFPPRIEVIGAEGAEFTKEEFFTGVNFFLAGERDFRIGKLPVHIPEYADGNVEFGDKEIPYTDFVRGVFWGLKNQRGTVTNEDHFRPMHYATVIAMDYAERAIMQQVPERNEAEIALLKNLLNPLATPKI